MLYESFYFTFVRLFCFCHQFLKLQSDIFEVCAEGEKYAKNDLRLLFFIAQEIGMEDLVEFLHLHFAV